MSFSMMNVILKEITTILQSRRFIEMQEVAPFTWVLFFDRAKLLVCMKGPFARFHLTKLPYRGKPVPLTHALAGDTLDHIELAGRDKILLLQFSQGKQLVFELIPGGKLLLTPSYTPPPCYFEHREMPISITSEELEQNTLKAMEEIWQKKWQEKMKKQIQYFEHEKEEGEKWKKTLHEAELLQAYFFKLKKGMEAVEIEDWEAEGRVKKIALDPTLNPHEQLEHRFKKGRKLKKKLEIAEKLLQEAQEKIQHPPSFPLPSQKPLEPPKKTHPFREFTTPSGLKIYVGKKDKDNDALTFSFARGSDYWFHAANTAGSHVILKIGKSEDPDKEAVDTALQLALYYSKSRGMHEEVIMTQCKYLSKKKGAKPGLVQVSKHKKILVKPNLEGIKTIIDFSKKNNHT